MNRKLLLIAFLCLFTPSLAWAAPAVVQSVDAGNGDGNGNNTASFGSLPTAGNYIVCIMWSGGSSPASNTCSDNQSGNTYSDLSGTTIVNDATSGTIRVWIAKVVGSSGTFTVTTHAGTGSGTGLVIMEVSGLDSSTPQDGLAQVTSHTAFDATTIAQAAGTATQNNDLMVLAAGNSASGKTYSWTAPLVLGQEVATPGVGGDTHHSGWGNISSTGAQTAQASWSGADAYISIAFLLQGPTAPTSQTAFRFRNDDGSETTATWLAAENTNITQPTMTNTRLRLQASTTGDVAATAFQIEYKKSTDSTYKRVGTTTTAITFVATSSSATGSTSVAPSYPTGIQKGDMLLLAVESKPGTATIVAPSGWTVSAVSNPIGGQGANGADTGTTTTKIFTKEADGTETGTQSVSITTGNSSLGQMAAYRRGTGMNWSTSTTSGVDNTGNDDWSAATTTAISMQPGDIIVTASGLNTDASGFTSPALTASGITFSNELGIASSSTATGNDTGLQLTQHTVNTGTGSAGPTLTATTNGKAANRPAGGTVFIRLRQTDDPIQLKATANISDTGAVTTAQLSIPGGKSFTAGQINDLLNPAASVDIAANNYSEFEWDLIATTTASNGDIYTFRITKNGTAIDNYTVTPQWTIGTVSPFTAATPRFLFKTGGIIFKQSIKF